MTNEQLLKEIEDGRTDFKNVEFSDTILIHNQDLNGLYDFERSIFKKGLSINKSTLKAPLLLFSVTFEGFLDIDDSMISDILLGGSKFSGESRLRIFNSTVRGTFNLSYVSSGSEIILRTTKFDEDVILEGLDEDSFTDFFISQVTFNGWVHCTSPAIAQLVELAKSKISTSLKVAREMIPQPAPKG